jgi:hypothetical protein
MVGHGGAVSSSTLLAGGHRALFCSLDHAIRLWDLNQGCELENHCADFVLTEVYPIMGKTKLMCFDYSGRMHLLSMNSAYG